LTSFVGRRAEVTQVKAVLATSRLVTLTGVGGCGKTRLALRVAGELRRTFSDGVWQVDLSAVQDPQLVVHAVAQACEITVAADRPVVDLVVEALREREMLLVLDDCEHLLDACASFVDTLLRAAADVRVLCTSRQSLAIVGEQVWPVAPLPVPDADRTLAPGAAAQYSAMTLFTERAAAAAPGFTLTADNEAVVARICRELDGLPLAIELAAARLRMLSLDQLADGLGDRFGLLVARHASPPRHRTLEAAVNWSFALCSPAEQDLWRRISVFVDGFDLTAVAALCDDGSTPGTICALLGGLVDQSVLSRDDSGGQVRYRLLTTIREYGLARLREHGDEEDRIRRRHRDHYLWVAEQSEARWFGAEQDRVFADLCRDHANLRAALDYCLSTPGEAAMGIHLAGTLWFFWIGCGFLAEGRHWLDRMLALEGPRDSRMKALWAGGAVAVEQGDAESAVGLLDECRELAAESGDELTLGYVKLGLGTLALIDDDHQRAQELLQGAHQRFEKLGVVDSVTLVGRAGLAMAHVGQGDLRRAEDICEQARAACQSRGDRWAMGWVSHVLSVTAFARGALSQAITYAHDGLRLHYSFHNLTGIATLAELLAAMLVVETAHEQAAVLHGLAANVWRMLDGRLSASRMLRAQHDPCEAQLRQAIGDQAYEEAHRRGTGLSLEDGLAFVVAGPAAAMRVAAEATAATAQKTLTRREHQVAELVAEGLSNREIADRLVTSLRTAESHVDHILRKLGFTSRTQVAMWVAQQADQAADATA
jgi:non-specific serine/threonine protein kinase